MDNRNPHFVSGDRCLDFVAWWEDEKSGYTRNTERWIGVLSEEYARMRLGIIQSVVAVHVSDCKLIF